MLVLFRWVAFRVESWCQSFKADYLLLSFELLSHIGQCISRLIVSKTSLIKIQRSFSNNDYTVFENHLKCLIFFMFGIFYEFFFLFQIDLSGNTVWSQPMLHLQCWMRLLCDFQPLYIFIHVLLCSMQILCRYAGRLSGLLPQNPDISKIVFKNSKRLKKVKKKKF